MPMHGEADLAAVGGLIADRTRATILLTLLGGGLTSASALAGRAEVSPSLASNHLRKPSEGGLAVVERRGRQRMYRLASSSIADALEALMPLAPSRREQSLRGVRARDASSPPEHPQKPLEPQERLASEELYTQAADQSAEQSFAEPEAAVPRVPRDGQAAQLAARKKKQRKLRAAA